MGHHLVFRYVFFLKDYRSLPAPIPERGDYAIWGLRWPFFCTALLSDWAMSKMLEHCWHCWGQYGFYMSSIVFAPFNNTIKIWCVCFFSSLIDRFMAVRFAKKIKQIEDMRATYVRVLKGQVLVTSDIVCIVTLVSKRWDNFDSVQLWKEAGHEQTPMFFLCAFPQLGTLLHEKLITQYHGAKNSAILVTLIRRKITRLDQSIDFAFSKSTFSTSSPVLMFGDLSQSLGSLNPSLLALPTHDFNAVQSHSDEQNVWIASG